MDPTPDTVRVRRSLSVPLPVTLKAVDPDAAQLMGFVTATFTDSPPDPDAAADMRIVTLIASTKLP